MGILFSEEEESSTIGLLHHFFNGNLSANILSPKKDLSKQLNYDKVSVFLTIKALKIRSKKPPNIPIKTSPKSIFI